MATDDTIIRNFEGVSFFDLAGQLAEIGERKPSPSGVSSKVLLRADDLVLLLMVMAAGAKIKKHNAPGTITIHALQGRVRVQLAEHTHDLQAGHILTLAPGIDHEVEAPEASAFLLTKSLSGGKEP